jgi:hypothetical protein
MVEEKNQDQLSRKMSKAVADGTVIGTVNLLNLDLLRLHEHYAG